MILFDYPLLAGDNLSISLYPTNLNPINDIIIQNAWFDDLYVTRDVDGLYVEGIEVPSEWDDDTVMHGEFNNTVLAGNVDFIKDNCEGFFIKRRDVDDLDWISLFYYPVTEISDFNVIFQDRTCALAHEYEYAFVPMINGFEGKYSVSDVVSTASNRIVLLDYKDIWSTAVTNGYCDTTRNYPISMLETLNSKYPTAVRNTLANYDTIQVSGCWIPTEDDCEIVDIQDNGNWRFMTKYSKEFVDFLTNDETKLLKSIDGRMWLCHLSSEVTDSADTVHYDRTLSFTMTELGDCYDEVDLNEAKFVSDDVIDHM